MKALVFAMAVMAGLAAVPAMAADLKVGSCTTCRSYCVRYQDAGEALVDPVSHDLARSTARVQR